MNLLDGTWSPFSRDTETRLIEAAQQGCQRSLNRLMAAYEERLEQLIACQGTGFLSPPEALQVAREGLWQAILSYEPPEQGRLWGTAWGIVSTTVWQEAKRVEWRQRRRRQRLVPLAEAETGEPMTLWRAQQVQTELAEIVAQLPEHLGQVVSAYYGLDGQPPATYRQIGPQMGLSHSRIWQLHREALARLSHPGHSYDLRRLVGRHSVADYQVARRLIRRWLRQRGGRRREAADAQPT